MPRSAASLTSLGVQRVAGRFAHTSTVHCHHTDTVLHSRKKAIHCKQSHSAGHSGQLVLLLGVAGGGAWGGSEHVVQNVPVGLVWRGVNDEGRVFLNSLGVDPDGRLSRDWDMERQKMAAVAWTDAETKAILTIWGTELVQKLLAKATRNKNIYEIVSKELSKVGVERN